MPKKLSEVTDRANEALEAVNRETRKLTRELNEIQSVLRCRPEEDSAADPDRKDNQQ
jgi:hypothetical protein